MLTQERRSRSPFALSFNGGQEPIADIFNLRDGIQCAKSEFGFGGVRSPSSTSASCYSDLAVSVQSVTSFEFAGHVLDLRQGRLRKGGVDVALRRKSFSPPHLPGSKFRPRAGKDELVAAVWPDVEVSDDSLTQCMKDIRKALGSDSDGFVPNRPAARLYRG